MSVRAISHAGLASQTRCLSGPLLQHLLQYLHSRFLFPSCPHCLSFATLFDDFLHSREREQKKKKEKGEGNKWVTTPGCWDLPRTSVQSRSFPKIDHIEIENGVGNRNRCFNSEERTPRQWFPSILSALFSLFLGGGDTKTNQGCTPQFSMGGIVFHRHLFPTCWSQGLLAALLLCRLLSVFSTIARATVQGNVKSSYLCAQSFLVRKSHGPFEPQWPPWLTLFWLVLSFLS